MLILVINSGSSSIKYQLFNTKVEESLAKGMIEKIGSNKANLEYATSSGYNIDKNVKAKNHKQAIKIAIDTLLDKEKGVVSDISQLSGVGHRVVHGAEEFKSSTIITPDVLKAINKYSELAPLHNPPAVKVIEAIKHILPHMRQVAVFDTSFHQSMPEEAYMYGLPYEYYKKYNLRKYGFHGTSHKFVALEATKELNCSLSELKIITCHLGNGCSITAIDRGNSIDTSMGFTPLEGLLMGTRCGDIDPAIIGYLMEKENLSVSQIDNLLNKQSGLLGISGISNDMREVEEAAGSNSRAQLAIKIFIYRIVKYIGSYLAILGGTDAIVFTGGIGEHQTGIRDKITDRLIPVLEGRETKIMVIPTNEELMIAKETQEVLSKS